MKDAIPAPASPSPPLHILIAGAGIGGLTASLALRRHGHHVTVLEQSRLANEIGAAISIAPNSNRILRRLGIFLERHGAVDCKGQSFWDATPKEVKLTDLSDVEATSGSPHHLMHRAHLHRAIKERALEVGVQLRTASRVVGVRQNKDGATVVLEGGEEVSGDVVVGADGVHSLTRPHLTGASQIKPFGSGMSGFRFLVPTSTLRADPLTAPFLARPGLIMILRGSIPTHLFVMYPCANSTIMNCMYALPTSSVSSPTPAANSTSGSTWANETSKETLLVHASSSLAPGPLAVVRKADPSGIRLWELLDMERLPTWTTGRLALMGDAAHPFTPYRGQGAAQAIEDAASLGVMLGRGTRSEQIEARLELYMRARRGRAEGIQEVSRGFSPLKQGPIKPLEGHGEGPWLWDEWEHSEEVLREALEGGEVS